MLQAAQLYSIISKDRVRTKYEEIDQANEQYNIKIHYEQIVDLKEAGQNKVLDWNNFER